MTEPARHHYVPVCWLRGFTADGGDSSALFVTDLRRRKQFESNPYGTGFINDFHRTSSPNPLEYETHFQWTERRTGTVFSDLYAKPRCPTDEQMSRLIEFAMFQAIRTPSFRNILNAIDKQRVEAGWDSALASEDAWIERLADQGEVATAGVTDYESMLLYRRDVVNDEAYYHQDNEHYLTNGYRLLRSVMLPSMSTRHWRPLISSSGSFIGSDNPVFIDGPPDQQIGYGNAEIVWFVVNRFIIVYGAQVATRPPTVTRTLIESLNTMVMLTAGERVYSHRSDFGWLDSMGIHRDDWKEFSIETTRKPASPIIIEPA